MNATKNELLTAIAKSESQWYPDYNLPCHDGRTLAGLVRGGLVEKGEINDHYSYRLTAAGWKKLNA